MITGAVFLIATFLFIPIPFFDSLVDSSQLQVNHVTLNNIPCDNHMISHFTCYNCHYNYTCTCIIIMCIMKLTYDGHMISSFRTLFIYLYALARPLAIIYDISKPVI